MAKTKERILTLKEIAGKNVHIITPTEYGHNIIWDWAKRAGYEMVCESSFDSAKFFGVSLFHDFSGTNLRTNPKSKTTFPTVFYYFIPQNNC